MSNPNFRLLNSRVIELFGPYWLIGPLLDPIGPYWASIGPYWALLGPIGPYTYRALLGPYWALLSVESDCHKTSKLGAKISPELPASVDGSVSKELARTLNRPRGLQVDPIGAQ